jgi:hypothetical protein
MLPQGPKKSPNKRERLMLIWFKLVHSLHLWLRPLRPPSTSFISISLILCACLVAGCSPQEKSKPGDPWDYADLRLLSPSDLDASPGDFIAGYSRSAGSDFQLRFDLLEITENPANDFYIALDYQPGGSYQLPILGSTDIAWDTLLFLPTSGIPQAFSPAAFGEFPEFFGDAAQPAGHESPIPRIIRIPWQDYILVSINQSFIPSEPKGIKIQAFSTAPVSDRIRDSIGPFSSESIPPEQAPLLLTFWNSFPAYSPAQALRKWDGAHTGPFGERHGLAILLNNIHKYSIPVVLLDLRSPAVLSALDHLDALPQIKELETEQLLTLPDSLPGSPSFPLFPDGLPGWTPAYYPEYTNQISNRFGLAPSKILYLPRTIESTPQDYSLYFAPADQNSSLEPQIPLPPQIPEESQAAPDGLPLIIRKQLLTNALQRTEGPGTFPLLVLGGDLQESAFADPASSAATLSYIANHPWIKPLDKHDLLTLPRQTKPQYLPGRSAVSKTEQFSPSVILSNLPDPATTRFNQIHQEAWNSAISLYSPLPPEPESLAGLRSNYTGQPGILLAAAQWSDEPHARMDCQSDLDLDGTPECILSTDTQYAVIDQLGARLIAYFYRTDSGIHQIIAPTSQLIVGLGDPSTWQLDAQDGADPAGIHGAFADSPPPWSLYIPSSNGDGITFTSPDQAIIKTYAFKEGGLLVTYHSADPASGGIPVAIDPWRRFSPNWSDFFQYQPVENGYQIAGADDLAIDFISSLPLTAYSFTDSQAFLDSPEDPNFDYPQGHYLPFPFTILEYQGQGDFWFHIKPYLP